MDNTRWNEVYSSGNVAWGNYTSTFLKEVIHLFPKGCKVLDLGCGNGRNLQYLINNGYDAVGYDFSHVAISQGLTTKIKHKDLIKEQWNIGKFDVVIDFGFYHLPYVITMIQEKIIFGLANGNSAYAHNSIWLNILPIFCPVTILSPFLTKEFSRLLYEVI